MIGVSTAKQHYESITLRASRRSTGIFWRALVFSLFFGTVLVGRRITVTKQNKRKRLLRIQQRPSRTNFAWYRWKWSCCCPYSALGLVDRDVERWMSCVFWCYADERGIPFSCYVRIFSCALLGLWDGGCYGIGSVYLVSCILPEASYDLATGM